MNDNPNPEAVPNPITPLKVLDVGALVPIDEEVLKHGVLFVHPNLPPFKLLFKIEDNLLKHSFEVVGPAPQPSSIIMPENKLILPEGSA
jgi:hypothetical protein